MRRKFWLREFGLPRWPWRDSEPDWIPPRQRSWPRHGTVVIWSSARVSERLLSWSAVARLEHEPIDLWHAEPLHPHRFVESVSVLPPPFVLSSLEQARRMGKGELAQGRRCWRSFSTGDIGTLAGLVRNEPPMLACLRNALPRTNGVQLRLSRVDEALLAPFSRWLTPMDVFKRMPAAWLELMRTYGDLFILTRLWRWTLGKQPALLAMPGDSPGPYGAAALKLTPTGQRLVHGVRSPDEAPVMPIGGHEAYGPETWVVNAAGGIREVSRVSTRRAEASPAASPARPRAPRGRRS